MKQIKCDRCGKVNDERKLVSCGISEFYVGRVEQYPYPEQPQFNAVDLCRGCNSELNRLVSAFMIYGPPNQSLEPTSREGQEDTDKD